MNFVDGRDATFCVSGVITG